ncbi:MAG TPA: hypothetical protein PKA89_15105, partial [Phycicoccus sp.]|nr:hypothetical protein [Phycicoccus sp.]
TWTDPTGRVRTTDPVDHRHLTLPDTGHDSRHPPPRPSLVDPDAPHSTLEFAIEHALGGRDPLPSTCRVEVRRPARPVHVTGLHPPRPGARRPLPAGPPF